MTVPDRLEQILKNGILRVGTTMDTPVFSMRNASGQLEGFDMDALETLGKALGVEIEYVKMTFGTMLDDLLADKFDIAMSGMGRTQRHGDRNCLTISVAKYEPQLLAGLHGCEQRVGNRCTDKTSLLIAGLDLETLRFTVIDDEIDTLRNHDAEWRLNHHHRLLGFGGNAHDQSGNQLIFFAGNNLLDRAAVDALKAELLVKTLQNARSAVSVGIAPTLEQACRGADGLVNCTPLGMVGYDGNAFAGIPLVGRKWLFDAVYTPLETPFLKEGKAAGIAILSGYELFLYQGIHAFKLFTGRSVDAEGLRQALEIDATA